MNNLAEVIQAIPEEAFWREADRRVDEHRRGAQVDELKKLQYKELVSDVAEVHGIGTAWLTKAKGSPAAKNARWQLYQECHFKGWAPPEIAQLTGHHRSRIRYSLRQQGLTPHEL